MRAEEFSEIHYKPNTKNRPDDEKNAEANFDDDLKCHVILLILFSEPSF